VREISCDSWGVDNIVEGQLVDGWAGLEEERERLEVVVSNGESLRNDEIPT